MYITYFYTWSQTNIRLALIFLRILTHFETGGQGGFSGDNKQPPESAFLKGRQMESAGGGSTKKKTLGKYPQAISPLNKNGIYCCSMQTYLAALAAGNFLDNAPDFIATVISNRLIQNLSEFSRDGIFPGKNTSYIITLPYGERTRIVYLQTIPVFTSHTNTSPLW
jgi:hypothetical protein